MQKFIKCPRQMMLGMATDNTLDGYRLFDKNIDNHDQLINEFEWAIPETFNIASYTVDRWADDDRVALYHNGSSGDTETYTFSDVQQKANQLANYFVEVGVEKGDRIGITAPQKPEAAIAHIASWKVGAIAIPISTLFGPDGLKSRLGNVDITAAVIDEASIEAFRQVKNDFKQLATTVTVDVDAPESGEIDFGDAIDGMSRDFKTLETNPEDTAIILFTSGTTGQPKGVVLGHEFLLGVLPGFNLWCLNLERTEDDIFYSSATWAWLISSYIIWCPWYFGIPVVTYSGQFDPKNDLKLIEQYDVTNYFSPPTAIRQLMQTDTDEFDIDSLRVIFSGGEEVTESVRSWIEETFEGTALNILYGQSEVSGIVAECQSLFDHKEGTMGKAIPGYDVSILDPDTAEPVGTNEVGEVAVHYEKIPSSYKQYWELPEETAASRTEGWHLTGDLASVDEEGYFSWEGRKDDVIISSGYRIGPEEIEDTVSNHDAVSHAGVIGIPHDTRGEVPKAYVELADGYDPLAELESEIQQFVKDKLAKYEYPREIDFIDEIPTTVTGKVRRVDLRESQSE